MNTVFIIEMMNLFLKINDHTNPLVILRFGQTVSHTLSLLDA